MSNPLQEIKALIPALPKGDIPFAEKFINNRDYESLKELTWSALKRLEKAYARETLPEKYKGVDVDKVRDLAALCFDYYYLIYPEELEETDPDDFEEAEES